MCSILTVHINKHFYPQIHFFSAETEHTVAEFSTGIMPLFNTENYFYLHKLMNSSAQGFSTMLQYPISFAYINTLVYHLHFFLSKNLHFLSYSLPIIKLTIWHRFKNALINQSQLYHEVLYPVYTMHALLFVK